MQLYVAVTDNDWFALHASKSVVEEVNFWRPAFKALQLGIVRFPLANVLRRKTHARPLLAI